MRGFGEQGEYGIYFREKMPNLGGELGTGEQRQYGGARNMRKHVHFILWYMGTSQFI